jgi:hypothetical protein
MVVVGGERPGKLVACSFVADARKGFAVLVAGLAAIGILDAGFGHEVALVAAIDKDLCGPLPAVPCGDAADLPALELDATVFFKSFVETEVDVHVREHLAEDLFVDMRLRAPVGGLVQIGDAVVGRCLQIEIAGVATDNFELAEISGGEAAGDHAADVVAGLEQDDVEAFFCGGVGGHDSRGGGAINDEISRLSGAREGAEQRNGEGAGETFEAEHKNNLTWKNASNPVTRSMLLRYIGSAGRISGIWMQCDRPSAKDMIPFGFDVDDHLEVPG